MSAESFVPTVQGLEKLVPELLQVSDVSSPSARDNCLMLLKSGARRWVILRSLYDRDCDFFVEFETELFKCADWLRALNLAVAEARSASLEFWLFDDFAALVKAQFLATLKSRYGLEDGDFQDLLAGSLFAVSERTIRNQFMQLVKSRVQVLGRKVVNEDSDATRKIHKFYKRSFTDVQAILATEASFDSGLSLDFLTNEVSAIAELLLAKIKGERRLFIHHDYVLTEELRDAAADWADRLKEIWKNEPILPIEIRYYSAFFDGVQTYAIYPVCLYYYQRAYYLCAFGQYPQSPENLASLGWYNYRLERIKTLEVLSWDAPDLPLPRAQILASPDRYSPDYVQQELGAAYGFDFYKPKELVLLRFEPSFARRYIDNSFRHPTFQRLRRDRDVIDLIEGLNLPEGDSLIARVRANPEAAYYTLYYRQNEHNAILRLRAWGPKVEVLLPATLRDCLRREIEETGKLYSE